MIVRLDTAWDLDPQGWAEALGADERVCARELMHYLSASIGDLELYTDNQAIVARDGTTAQALPDQLDGRVRFELGWLIETTAEDWRRIRQERQSIAEVPTLDRAHLDLATYTARELYGLPQICETDAVMRVLHPYTATYTPQIRMRPFPRA